MLDALMTNLSNGLAFLHTATPALIVVAMGAATGTASAWLHTRTWRR